VGSSSGIPGSFLGASADLQYVDVEESNKSDPLLSHFSGLDCKTKIFGLLPSTSYMAVTAIPN
jgi:hypothetical protein